MASRRAQKDRRKQSREGTPSESFQRKMQQGPFTGLPLVIAPAGQEKMSDVLEKFVEPYADYFIRKGAYRILLGVGVVAWNAALFPEERWHAVLDEALTKILPPDAVEAKEEMRFIVERLMARKQAHFSSIRRFIVSFEFREEDAYLSVASTLNETPIM